MTLTLHNTLTRKDETFTPLDAKNVRMYVCGPTVYDRPHLGNARSVVVYDVLFRLLNHLYGAQHVNYARNITDVDDKINARAVERGISIQALTAEVTAQFHADMGALNCLKPTHEPRATAHVPVMIAITEQLIANGHAYVAEGHVLFDVNSYAQYGQLSGRKLDDLVAGARVEVEGYKKNPGDFVLWKPADAQDDASSVFDSPWGKGRPGWHIECSAMSSTYLGHTFDIHGGGADLMFPHHENEIAQSRCADKEGEFAKLWVHNGFLTVNGEKMSKSLGNFITVYDLLEKGVKGEVIRLALLSAHYRKPLDWNDKLVEDAKKALDKWYRQIAEVQKSRSADNAASLHLSNSAFLDSLCNDLNFPIAISQMHAAAPDELYAMGKMLGFFRMTSEEWFAADTSGLDVAGIEAQIEARKAAKAAKNFAEADRIRNALKDQGIELEDKPGGVVEWRKI